MEAAGREVYKYYYRLRYPLDTDEWGRPSRTGPLHERLQDVGRRVRREERLGAARLLPARARPWRRAGADQREFGWTRPPYFDRLAAEHAALRERVGIIDLSSFGKIEIEGPGALALSTASRDNRIDRPIRAASSTPSF